MANGDLLETLLAHDRWATGQVLDACAGLSEEQLHRRFEIGPGSLHDTLVHMAGAIRTWTETLAGWPARPRPEGDGKRRTVGEMRAMLEEAWGEFGAEARRAPVDERVERRLRDGRVVVMARGAVLAHVATHGVHHRAQCLNMLRRLGVERLPGSSVTEWVMAGKG